MNKVIEKYVNDSLNRELKCRLKHEKGGSDGWIFHKGESIYGQEVVAGQFSIEELYHAIEQWASVNDVKLVDVCKIEGESNLPTQDTFMKIMEELDSVKGNTVLYIKNYSKVSENLRKYIHDVFHDGQYRRCEVVEACSGRDIYRGVGEYKPANFLFTIFVHDEENPLCLDASEIGGFGDLTFIK